MRRTTGLLQGLDVRRGRAALDREAWWPALGGVLSRSSTAVTVGPPSDEQRRTPVEHAVVDLGDFPLQKGSVLPRAKLGYTTLGELNDARDNVVVCPTWFTATPSDTAQWMTGADRALDPGRYVIIVPRTTPGPR